MLATILSIKAKNKRLAIGETTFDNVTLGSVVDGSVSPHIPAGQMTQIPVVPMHGEPSATQVVNPAPWHVDIPSSNYGVENSPITTSPQPPEPQLPSPQVIPAPQPPAPIAQPLDPQPSATQTPAIPDYDVGDMPNNNQ